MEKKLILNALRLDRVGEKSGDGLVPIEGYACHYGVANHNGEIVDENSFSYWLGKMKEGGVMPIFNYQHGSDIIGGWDRFESDATGLKGYGHLNTNVAFVRDNVLPLVESGDVTYLSTEGWCDWDSIEERGDSLYLGKFILCGVSLVSLPADFGAKMTIKNEYAAWKQQHKPERVITIY